MNATDSKQNGAAAAEEVLPLAERLALAQEIVAKPRFRALCFWNWPAAISVTEDALPGIARALQKLNAELRPKLKKAGHLRRDPREKERKKAGQPGARKRFQFSKR